MSNAPLESEINNGLKEYHGLILKSLFMVVNRNKLDKKAELDHSN